MYEISVEEKSIASALLKKGYEKAAKSFSQIARQNVSITTSSIDFAKDNNGLFKKLKKDEELVMITTAIIGQLQGKSYFILNYDECDEIFKSCFNLNNSGYKNLIEAETFLKELDNIISASVITEFSNHLDVMIYGDVPILSKTNIVSIKDKLSHDLIDDGKESLFVTSNAKFEFENNAQLQPQFIWKLSPAFIDRIRDISNTKKMPL